MSHLAIEKKLRGAEKALKGFAFAVRSKLLKIKRCKPVKATAKHLDATLSALLNSSCLSPHRETSHVRRHHWVSTPVYIDELCGHDDHAVKTTDAPAASTDLDDLKEPISQRYELWGVDERAEKFIAMFYEQIKLQREKSLGEYHEMLARGVM